MAAVGGRIDGRIAAKLLMAAALVDLVAVLFLTKTFGRIVVSVLNTQNRRSGNQAETGLSFLTGLPNEAIFILLFGVIFAVYWVFMETIMGGRTIGRALLGLHMCDAAGAPFGSGRRMTRGLRKVTSLGLPGLQISGPARYDRNSGCVWHGSMAPRSVGAIETWVLVLTTPDKKRKTAPLSQISSFRNTKTIKIGRDPNWADLVLPADSRASAKHCILSVRGGRLMLADNNSSNGTFLAGKRLKPKTWVPLSGTEEFKAADIKMQFQP